MDIFKWLENEKPKDEHEPQEFVYIFDRYLLESSVLDLQHRLPVTLQGNGPKKYASLDFQTIFTMLGMEHSEEPANNITDSKEMQNQGVVLLNWDMGRGKTTQLKK